MKYKNKRLIKTLKEMGVRFYTLKEWEKKERERILKIPPGKRIAMALWMLNEAKKLSPRHR